MNLNLLLYVIQLLDVVEKKENSISENNSYDDDDGNDVFLGESHPSVN